MARGINEGENISQAMLQKYLQGVEYPAGKDDLRRVAEQNGATEEVLQMIGNLPDDKYGGPQDVMNGYGEEKMAVQGNGWSDMRRGGQSSEGNDINSKNGKKKNTDEDEDEE